MKRKSKSNYVEHIERIDATPESVARLIMKAPPKSKVDWRLCKI